MMHDISLAKELIVEAIKLGVIDLNIKILDKGKEIVLPDVVLQSQTLARLYLNGSFTINQEKEEEVTCYNLKSLKLEFVSSTINDSLWARFTCLKELEIAYYRGDDLKIRIPLLERISILGLRNVNVELDFPNIQKLEFEGRLLRHFQLKTRRDEWESEIQIYYSEYEHSGEWFSRLSQFLRMVTLSRSRVSLSILMCEHIRDVDEFRYVGDGLAIAVEKLNLCGRKVTPANLDALFWSCRPKFVEIRNQCLFGLKKVNVEEFQQLRSLPWETFYHVSSSDEYGYDVRFQLN